MSGCAIGRPLRPMTVSSPTSATSSRRSTGSGSHPMSGSPCAITWYLILAHYWLMAANGRGGRMLRPMTIEQPEPSVSVLVHRGDGKVETLPADRLDDLDRLLASDGAVLWVHLFRPT